jgi:hypothetical protein
MDIEREKLMLKVIGGKATNEEAADLTAWLDAHPEHKEEFDAMKMLLSPEFSLAEQEPDPAAMAFAKLEANRKKRIRFITLRNQAAVFVLVLSAVISTLSLLGHYTHTHTTAEGFVFADASFAEIKQSIEERMDIKIEVESPNILICRFTGAFPASATAEDILEGITYQTGVSVHSIDGRYILRGRGCGAKQ